jgi:hypothetical protein
MDVLITFGRYAGQIRDIEPQAALAMLKDGRAKRPGEPLFSVPPEALGEVESKTFAPSEIAQVGPIAPSDVTPLAIRKRRR